MLAVLGRSVRRVWRFLEVDRENFAATRQDLVGAHADVAAAAQGLDDPAAAPSPRGFRARSGGSGEQNFCVYGARKVWLQLRGEGTYVALHGRAPMRQMGL